MGDAVECVAVGKSGTRLFGSVLFGDVLFGDVPAEREGSATGLLMDRIGIAVLLGLLSPELRLLSLNGSAKGSLLGAAPGVADPGIADWAAVCKMTGVAAVVAAALLVSAFSPECGR